MIILSIDSGKNFGMCLYNSETNEHKLNEINFKTSLDAFVDFQQEFEKYIHTLGKIDKVILEFSPFGHFQAQLSHFFYLATVYGSISRLFGPNVYQLFPENKASKYGVQANVWQSFIASKMGIKPKEFSKEKSIEFANTLIKNKEKIKSDHKADAVCIMYWYVNSYLKLK